MGFIQDGPAYKDTRAHADDGSRGRPQHDPSAVSSEERATCARRAERGRRSRSAVRTSRMAKHTAAPRTGNSGAGAAGVVGDGDDAGAGERGDRVELVAQHGRDLAQQHVAQHAAADAGDGAEDGGLHGPEAEVERFAGAGDAEEGEADRVEDRGRCADALERGAGEEAHQRRPRRRRPGSASRGTSPAACRSAGRV